MIEKMSAGTPLTEKHCEAPYKMMLDRVVYAETPIVLDRMAPCLTMPAVFMLLQDERPVLIQSESHYVKECSPMHPAKIWTEDK